MKRILHKKTGYYYFDTHHNIKLTTNKIRTIITYTHKGMMTLRKRLHIFQFSSKSSSFKQIKNEPEDYIRRRCFLKKKKNKLQFTQNIKPASHLIPEIILSNSKNL